MRWQTNVKPKVWIAGQNNFAALDHQDVGAQRGLPFINVRWTGDIADHGAWLALGHIDHALVVGCGRGNDQVHLAHIVVRRGGNGDLRAGCLCFDLALKSDQFLGPGRDQGYFTQRLRQQPAANRANRAGRTDDHRLATG